MPLTPRTIITTMHLETERLLLRTPQDGDLDAYLPAGGMPLRCLGNRGANGIDGVVSTALGVAAAGLGIPISEDLTLLLGGALASRGVTSYWPTLAAGYFGVLLGCSMIGQPGFSKYTGSNSMGDVHRFMDLNQYQLGYGTAVAYLLFAIVLVLTILQFRLLADREEVRAAR